MDLEILWLWPFLDSVLFSIWQTTCKICQGLFANISLLINVFIPTDHQFTSSENCDSMFGGDLDLACKLEKDSGLYYLEHLLFDKLHETRNLLF